MHDIEMGAVTLLMTIIRNKIRDNLLCDLCGVVEDVILYFFRCKNSQSKGRFSMIQLEFFSP